MGELANLILNYKTQVEQSVEDARLVMLIHKMLEPKSYQRFCCICGKQFVSDRPTAFCSKECDAQDDKDVKEYCNDALWNLLPKAVGVIDELGIPDEYVYFIQDEQSGNIKIGYSKDVKKRLSELQTATPNTLNILCYMRGDIGLESELHQRFLDYRVSGEWFAPNQELMDLIGDLVMKN